MAIVNDPRLYSGGSAILDSTPSVNLYANLLAKKQAKIDALDEYDKKRIDTINPNGVRDVDREGLDGRIGQLRSFYNQNKDNIRKGGTPESYEYEKMFRNVGTYINQSKERTAKQEAAMKLYQERLKQDGRIPDDFIAELSENDAAIDAISGVEKETGNVRKTKSFDITKWLSQPKPFNQQTYLKSFADVKRTPGQPTYTPIEGQPLKMTETIEEKFDEGGKQVIAARAADKYQNSYSFAEQVKAEMQDPIARKKLEDVFQAEFGTNPTQPEDYATALTMSLLQPKLAKTRAIDNKEAIMDRSFADWIKKNNITSAQAYQRALIARQGATSGYNPTSGNAFDEIPDMDMQSGKKIVNGTVYNPDGTPYTSPSGAGDIFIPKNKLPSSVLTSLKAAGIDPSQIGEGVNVSVKDGVITTMETKRNGIISRQNMENYQKAFNKEPMKSAQPSFGKPVFQPTQTTNKSKSGGVPEKVERKYSKDELLKGGWTQDQINKAVKAGKLKLK